MDDRELLQILAEKSGKRHASSHERIYGAMLLHRQTETGGFSC